MQVSVETTSGPERKMTVSVPSEQLEQEIDRRLKSLARTARIDGFRPGKVPVKVVATRFGPRVRQEVVSEMTQTTLQQAIAQENLRLAGMPRFESRQAEKGQDLEYTVVFEVMQELELGSLDGVSIERPVAGIADADVDNMIENLRKQRMEYNDVDRAAQDGDRVTIDFKGMIDGEAFPGGSAEGQSITLGSGSFIPGFEEQLVGLGAGEEKTVDVTFPESYHSSDLAGKAAQFEVKVRAVSEGHLPEVDETFVRSFEIGDGSVESFRNEVRKSMQAELDQAIHKKVKEQVMDALLKTNESLDLPPSMVNREIENLMTETRNMLSSQGVQADALELEPATFEDRARQRVALTMIVSEIVRQNNLQSDPAKIRSEIENLAASYDDPDEVIRWYYADQSRLTSIENIVLENAVVDWVLENVEVTDKAGSFSELMQSQSAAG